MERKTKIKAEEDDAFDALFSPCSSPPPEENHPTPAPALTLEGDQALSQHNARETTPSTIEEEQVVVERDVEVTIPHNAKKIRLNVIIVRFLRLPLFHVTD